MPLDLSLQRADRLGGERLCQQPPQPGVLGRVHVEHHPAHVGQVVLGPRIAHLGATERRREGRRILEHPVDVGMAQHQPVARPFRPAGQGRLGDRDDPVSVAQTREGGIRDVPGVGRGVVDDTRPAPLDLGEPRVCRVHPRAGG